MPYSFNLVEGADYTFEDGKGTVLTQTGFERMVEAHAAGRDVIIEIDGVVISRLSAWWG
jgi:hypothetical protein